MKCYSLSNRTVQKTDMLSKVIIKQMVLYICYKAKYIT